MNVFGYKIIAAIIKITTGTNRVPLTALEEINRIRVTQRSLPEHSSFTAKRYSKATQDSQPLVLHHLCREILGVEPYHVSQYRQLRNHLGKATR